MLNIKILNSCMYLNNPYLSFINIYDILTNIIHYINDRNPI